MSVARRPLLTATAAGTLLCALWFVPSANATAERQAAQAAGAALQSSGASASGNAQGAREARVPQGAQEAQGGATRELRLADTGTVDTTPYLIGGTAFLGIGAAFVTFAARRGAAAF
ncbi:hypothetical protein ACFU5O_09255 [Streptomyces sp. NPDC057445]|uniref:hypothetical protein n=1 Tax=Streptomyces sp. NPDC057445 TaxID=3346136 RepID=UPI00367A97C8